MPGEKGSTQIIGGKSGSWRAICLGNRVCWSLGAKVAWGDGAIRRAVTQVNPQLGVPGLGLPLPPPPGRAVAKPPGQPGV